MTCKHCGKSNRDDATVCKYCGKELTSEPKAKSSRADAQGAAIQSLRQISMVLMAATVLALILGLAGLLRGCSAASAAKEAAEAAKTAQTTADAVKASADQTTRALQQALERIQDLEDAASATPPTPTQPDVPPEPTVQNHRYPSEDPVVGITATLDDDGKVTALAYTDANGALVGLEAGAAGVPVRYVLNDVDKLVGYESDIDLCAACTATLPSGYTGVVTYRWESLSGAAWEPRPDKTEQCLTVSPGYWFSTRAQYRCEIILTVRDASGVETDSVKVYTTAVTYTDWETYAESHADEHDVFLQWSDMMKTYQ